MSYSPSSRALLLAAALLGACAPPEMPEVEVVHAELQDLGLGNFSVVVGFVGGQGDLEFVDTEGNLWWAPVRLRGPELGLATGGGFPVTQYRDSVFADGEPASATLDLPAPSVPASTLVGRYRGLGAGAEVIAGARYYWLVNRDDVGLQWLDVRVGVGISVAYEWVELTLLDDPRIIGEPDLPTD